ncbi:SRPBCC domain-containing protein [Uliginosibacterium flavum]|uniref:SRPBCC domain-containing protein n=1 Tax=Uliginosibacterium flavum TaxID=1396831 RepID=A0ABV2TJD7_9RHOO
MFQSAALAVSDNPCEVLITRVFDAPRELVFRTWTEPAHVARWWLPPGFTATECEIDLRVGGRFFLSMRSPEGDDYPCEGIYEEITPPARLIYRGIDDDRHACGSGLPPRGRVTVSFVEQGSQTRLSLHARFASARAREEAMAMGFDSSWQGALSGFAAYLQQLS